MTKIVFDPDAQPRAHNADARLQFATWLQETHPKIYSEAIQHAKKYDAGLGDTEPEKKSFWQRFTEGAAALGTTYLSLKNQRDAMEMNLARAQQGLPPLDVSSTAPVVRTQVDIDPALATRLASSAGEGISRTMMLMGAVALAAILLLKKR